MKFRKLSTGFVAWILLSTAQMFAQSPPISDPAVWLRGDMGIITDGAGLIERWEDQSGNGNHFEQSDESKRPAIVTNAFTSGGGQLSRIALNANGNSSYTGTVGTDFVVDEEIQVTELGVFDNNRDGLSESITVAIWQRLENGTPEITTDDGEGAILTQLEFTVAEPGDLEGNQRWKSLAAPVTLAPGSYYIGAWGYGSQSYHVASNDSGSAVRAVRRVGKGRYSPAGSPGAWGTSFSSYDDRYASAANFRFTISGETLFERAAVRFDGSNDGLQAPETLSLSRPGSIFIVYERDWNDGGFIMQNSSGGPHWYLSQNLAYCNGVVRNQERDWREPWFVEMENQAAGTRVRVNGEDWTHFGNFNAANPGRLAIGGGVGRSTSPVAARIAEILAYEKELTDSERWVVNNYLAERYGFDALPVDTPVISPSAALGSSPVSVTISCATPGAAIRYTLDGSEPDTASPLYSAAISVARGTEVRAKAFLASNPESGVAARYYEDSSASEVPVGGANLWLRADRGVELDSEGRVMQWQDLSGNGRDFEQGTGYQRPALEPIGLSVGGGTAIQTSTNTNAGVYAHNGTLGMDFIVTEEIEITELQAFDHLGDGFATAVTVAIWERNESGTPRTPEDDLAGTSLVEVEFTPAEPGTLGADSLRSKTLPSPLILTPGSYTLLGWGFSGTNLYKNSTSGSWLSGQGIEFVNRSRYISTLGAWPTNLDSDEVKYEGSANFVFNRTSGTVSSLPTVSFDGVNDGLWAVPGSEIDRPATVFVVFERKGTSGGYVMQSSPGDANWWMLRNDGFYNTNWVNNRTIPRAEVAIAGMTMEGAGSRFFMNGEDWTEHETRVGSPNRLTLGGGVGNSYSPLWVEIAEVLSFDRVLNESEMLSVENWLESRYLGEPRSAPEVAFSPEGDFGTGAVSVTLESAVGAEIRYTLDGSEPSEASPLYTGALAVARGTKVRARAYLAGLGGSVRDEFYGDSGGIELPVADATMWLRADCGLTVDGEGRVSSWSDLTGNGNDVLQSISSLRPTLVSDGINDTSRGAIRITDDIGTRNYSGSLGNDLTVHSEIELTHLGAFDHLGDGFSGTITVEVWTRDDNGTAARGDDSGGVLLASETFTQASPGELVGTQQRFKPLPSPVTLGPGEYTVFAWGYTGGDRYRESQGSNTISDDRFSFPTCVYNGTAGAFPTIVDGSGPLDYNGVANFRVAPEGGSASVPAVVFDGVDDALHGVEAMDFGRPSTVFVTFEVDREDNGDVLQNSSGSNWSIDRRGFYAGGWVREESFELRTPMLAAMVNDTDQTTAWRNGNNVTVNPFLSSASPGRLLLGGGENGVSFDPIAVRISEVVVYDRALDESEISLVSNYLAARSGVYPARAETPEIGPFASYGSNSVEVSISSVTPGVEIRYTLDGSEPTAGSALYAGPFSVPRGTLVKAKAFGPGLEASPVAETFYGDENEHPLPVSDPAFWITGDVGVELGTSGRVERWRDLSGHGRDVYQVSEERAPALVEDAFGGEGKSRLLAPYTSSSLTGGYSGFIGSDFQVDRSLEVTHLGALDAYGDGIKGSITVKLIEMDDGGTSGNTSADRSDDTAGALLAELTFTDANPGVLEEGIRLLPLPSPILLQPGTYALYATGYTGDDIYLSQDLNNQPVNFGITYLNRSRYSQNEATLYPGTAVNDDRYLMTANCRFRIPNLTAAQPPTNAVRFDGVNDGLLGPVDYLVERPSTVFMVLEHLGGSYGRLLQSASGNNWLLGPHSGTQGFYADGWISQTPLPSDQPVLVIGEQGEGGSRYFFAGRDSTQNPSYVGNLGRIALGGGEGVYNQPVNADLAELIIYDRVLTPGERQAVAKALSDKHGLTPEALPEPGMTPRGGLFATSQTITLEGQVPGAEIRYTLDGSEPTESSTLYAGSFTVSANTTVKARSFLSGYLASPVTTGVFFIDGAAPVPPSRDNLTLWLSGTYGVEVDGSEVTTWRDLSGQGADAVVAASSSAPTFSATAIGNSGGVLFDGVDDYLSVRPGFEDFENGLTAIFVTSPDESLSSWERLIDFGQGTNNDNIFFAREATSTNFHFGLRRGGSSSGISSTDSLRSLTDQILTVVQEPDGRTRIYRNGNLEVEGNVDLPFNVIRHLNYVGRSNWSNDAYFSGAMSEVILFKGTLNDFDREVFEDEIRATYGIASSATGVVGFSPSGGGLHPGGVTVELQSASPGAAIYYTLDGSVPDESSTLYEASIVLTASARVRARAFLDGFNPSNLSEATYLIGDPPGGGDGLLGTYYDNEDFTGASLTRLDPNVDFNWGGGSPDPAIGPDYFSVRWTGQILPRFSEEYIFSTRDDGSRLMIDLDRNGTFEPSEVLIDELDSSSLVERFAAPVTLEAGVLYDIQLEYVEEVSSAVISFRWESFSEPFAAVPQSQLFSDAEFSQTVSTPVISPAGGTYTSAVEVSIETSTDGATLYVTTDGSIPDQGSPVYTGSFTVPADATVRARGYKAGFNPSGVASAAYDIDAQPPTITSFSWNGSPLLGGEVLTESGQLSVTATDNQGVASAEFYYQPVGAQNQVLIGRDTFEGNGLLANWNVGSVPDGSYNLIARVFDTAGTFSEEQIEISVNLATLPAPVISQPGTGVEVEEPTVTLQITTVPSANVRIRRDGTLIFSGYANSGGFLNYTASLPVGLSSFVATAVNRAGSSPNSNAVSVTRVREFPQLTLAFPSDTLAEGAPLQGQVSIPSAVAEDVSVVVGTNRAGEVETLQPILIPAGSTSADFILTAIQDSRVEAPSTVTVNATALNHRDATSNLFLLDDDTPVLTLEVDETSVSEDFGAVTARVRRADASSLSQRVYLSNTAPDQATVPSFVTIPAGQLEIGFVVSIIDNSLADGNQFLDLQARVEAGSQVVSTSSISTLEVRDNEGPSLTLLPDASLLNEGSIHSFTLRRGGLEPVDALTVDLTQTPMGEISAPSSVTFPAGVSEVPVSVTALNSVSSGTRTVILRASAPGYTDGLARFSVTDEALPDFAPDQLSAPLTAKSESTISVGYRVRNLGLEDSIENIFLERVYLSTDPSPSEDDVILRQIEQTGDVLANGSYSRNVSIFVPREVGEYYLIVTVDPANTVEEVLETNNTAVRAIPLEVIPAYNVVVQAEETTIPANTPIEFTGSATTPEGLDASFSMVNIHIRMGETERVISAFTDSNGDFTTTWTPLPNEGGSYTIGATHPGTSSAPVQDAFEILTIGFSQPPAVRLNEGETVVVQTTLSNPNSQDLTGVDLSVVSDLPSGLTISPMAPGTMIPAGGEMVVPISVSAAAGFSGTGLFGLEVNTAEGVLRARGISVRADRLVPVLTLDPSSLDCSVLRGTSKSASFQVTNTGGLATGPIQVLLPDVPWMSLSSSNPIASLDPGESTTVSLQLAPDATVDLTLFTGNLALNAANGGSRNINYRFRVVSDLMGDLDIKVVDELYYFTEEAPALEGATVVVRDAISSQQIATVTTGLDGVASFPDLMEGWYRVEVTAPQHERYSNNIFVNAGVLTTELAFISKQLVTYTWTVEEVEIEDTYRITVETTFETNVPAPVVTLSPASIDVEDLRALGQGKVVNVTITNQGFIDAQNSEFEFSSHPFYRFTPLIQNVGTIPAKSSLVVPVSITRIGIFDEEGNVVTLDEGGLKSVRKLKKGEKAASVPCGAGGKLVWSYPCGPNDVGKSSGIGFSGVVGNCGGGGGGGGGGYLGFHGGYFGSGGGGGGGGGGASGSSSSFSSLDACDPCVQKAALDCVIGYIPIIGDLYSAWNCGYNTGTAIMTGEGGARAAGDCALAAAGFFDPTPATATIACLEAMRRCAADAGGGGGGGAGGGGGPGGPFGGGSAKLASFKERKGDKSGAAVVIGVPWYEYLSVEQRQFALEATPGFSRLETYFDVPAVIFGSRERVFLMTYDEGIAWHARFVQAIQNDSPDEVFISAAEAAELATLAEPFDSYAPEFAAIVARWNRTWEYSLLDIFEPEDVPEGDSVDFIYDSQLKEAVGNFIEAVDESREEGFLDPLEQSIKGVQEVQEALADGQGGACARVKIEISQDLMLTRTAFEATLVLENERDDANVTDVGFDLQIRDLLGEPSEDLFNIQVSRLDGLDSIEGSGTIDESSSGTVQWTLIPRDTAALTEEKQYTVGGVITFEQDGLEFTIPVENVPITVRPDAALSLKYFHQRDVYADDPYTDAIEPSVPYKLAVLVENSGYGTARDLKIISGQPEIVENEKGLFVDFKIIATQVDGESVTPSLTADFGDLGPQENAIATWFMTSTLQGLFIDYDATFEHVTGLGDSRISLLQNVEIHEMIRVIDAKDGSTAFLVNDVVDVNDYPDTIHFQDGEIELVTVQESGSVTGTLGSGNFSVTLNTGAFSGWNYIRIPDPGDGDFNLVSVARSDGEILQLDSNAWSTDRTFIGQGRRPIYENILHLVDCDSPGTYTLTYEVNPEADSVPPTSSMAALPANSPADIPVFWSGSDNVGVALYDVYVSANGSAWSLWKDNTPEAGAVYPGTVGETYSFYSVAIDHAGNNEVKSPVAEATTTVVDENLPPTISPIADQSIQEGQTFILQAYANDPDGNNGDLRFSVGTTATGLTINPITGEMRWVTGETSGGSTITVVVVAQDAAEPAGVANEEFTITVQDTNSAPTLNSVSPRTLSAGGVLIVDMDASDGDVPIQQLTYSLGSNAPTGAAIDSATGVVTWMPTNEQAGKSHIITVMATDNGSPNLMAQSSFSVTVVDVEEDLPPAFAPIPVLLWLEGRSYSFDVVAVDPDGDPIVLGANVSGAPGSSFSDLGGGVGRVAWDTSGVAAASYQIPLTATANGLTTTGQLVIQVAEDDLYWSWVTEAFGEELPSDVSLGDLGPDADPDGDQRANVYEMAMLTNPLTDDEPPIAIELSEQGSFRLVQITMHRRKGSEDYVEFAPQRSSDIGGGWEEIPSFDWNASIDLFGDDDGRPETESMDFTIFEFDPAELPEKYFFRLNATEAAAE
ncbi:chitobiase/beta-hexosaminidase C-terminal domain-containing protein [Roseibacillus persicicus]|nr:chitobiase/beta-hexosaminidase C-terminal domain-containing protein [Roseibacillus persicicus]